MPRSTIRDYLDTHSQDSILSALAVSQWGSGETTEADRLYRSSGQPGDLDHPPAAPLYKESPAKSGTSPGTRSGCGAWAIISECSTGLHHFGKSLLCGQEWCPDCGAEGSATHKRRQARLLPKMQLVKTLGYFVVEFPDALRRVGRAGVTPDVDTLRSFRCHNCQGIRYWARGDEKFCARCHPPGDGVPVSIGGDDEHIHGWCYSKADLRDTTNTIVDVIAGKRGAGGRGRKRVDGLFSRGVARWHWFGDTCKHENRKGKRVLCRLSGKRCVLRSNPRAKSCVDFVNNGKWNPHLNVLVDVGSALFEHDGSGFIPKAVLEDIKTRLRDALNCPELIVHYSYKDTPGQLVQTVQYVTRATFTNREWEGYMSNELYNFRNQRWWGSWTGDNVWELAEAEDEGADVEGLAVVDSLTSGICPDCGQPLKVLHHDARGHPVHWTRAVDSAHLLAWGAVEIAGTGYYRIPRRGSDGSHLTPEDIISLERVAAMASSRSRRHVSRRGKRPRVDDSLNDSPGLTALESDEDGLPSDSENPSRGDDEVWDE